MRTLLTGAAGQLGSELLPLLTRHGHVTATDLGIPGDEPANWVKLDISDGSQLQLLLNRLQPDLIVNTAAYTAVDQAESDSATAYDVNAELPGRLAHWASKNEACLVHYSTDYVFNGKSGVPYDETDTPDPQSVYGASKLAGEQAIAAAGCKHVTLRTSWVYSSHGKNFVLSMLDLARRGLSLKIVDDQQGCPTWARNLAQATDAVIETWQSSGVNDRIGLYHYCDDRSLNWYEFADRIFSLAASSGLLDKLPEIAPVPSSEFPQPASRPVWSVLSTGKIGTAFNIAPASFNQSLQAVIDEIRTKELT